MKKKFDKIEKQIEKNLKNDQVYIP